MNGQKVWTSGAHHADWCLCFVRTDPTAPKHKGISALIIDTTTPGVERRPFPELSDRDFCDFNEVFFTDVRVPKENLIGPLNGGWPITQGSLAHERAMFWIDYAYEPAARGARARRARRPRRRPAAAGSATTPRYRDAVAGFYIDAQALLGDGLPRLLEVPGGQVVARALAAQALRERVAAAARCSSAPRRSGSTALDLDRARPADVARGLVGDRSTCARSAATIPGGTSEIQRNIIAERVLGPSPVA